MSRIKDIRGSKFGRWTVLAYSHYKKESFWLCRCSCGNERRISISALNRGRSKSCGCLNKEKKWKKQNFKGYGFSNETLHDRMKKLINKAELCQICKQKQPVDLANKSQKYLMKKSDWMWLCRQCHIRYDRGWKFIRNKWFKTCKKCNKQKEVNESNFYKQKTGSWFIYCKPCWSKIKYPNKS